MKHLITFSLFVFIYNQTFSQDSPHSNNVSGNDWHRGGNSGVNGDYNVLGTSWSSPLYFQTNNNLKLKINGTVSYPINGQNANRSGFALLTNNPTAISYEGSIGTNPMTNSSFGAYSLLHLIGDESPNVQTDGYRNWMRNGITFSNNFDAGFIGVRRMQGNNSLGDDVSDFVINWSDNYGVASSEGTPDNLVFCFTSGEGTGNYLVGNSNLGRETMRMTSEGNIGIGPDFNNVNQPKSELHINSENNTESYLQITNSTTTGSQINDGLRIGYPTNNAINQGALINQQENDRLTIRTNSLERIRISHTGALNAGINSNPANLNLNLTRIGISHNPFLPVTQPRSLLHLGYNTPFLGNTSGDGWRNWMDVGMYIAKGSDNMYFGLKNQGNNNRNDAVIGWGDDFFNLNPFNPTGPDVLRFIFTSVLSNQANALKSNTNEGLEIARMVPTARSTSPLDFGMMGIGDFQNNIQPINAKLDIDGDLRIREVKPGPNLNRILVIDTLDLNRVKYIELNNLGGSGQGFVSCHDTSAISYLIEDKKINLNDFNAYFEGNNSNNFQNNVGFGYTCGTPIKAKVDVMQLGKGGIAGNFFAKEDFSWGNNNIMPTGAIGIASGDGANLAYYVGLAGHALGYNTESNFGIYGSASNSSNISRAGYFSGNIEVNGTVYSSDQMFKIELNELSTALGTIHKLKPQSYFFDTLNYTSFNFDSKKQYGFVAQEVETILPELVYESVNPGYIDSLGNFINDPIHYKSLNYNGIIPIATRAIQELDEKVDRMTLSDVTLKTNVINLENSLQKVLSLRGVSYNWNNTGNLNYTLDTMEHIGYIAQEVDTIDHRLTFIGIDSFLHVDYTKIIPLLTESIQELNLISIQKDSIINSLTNRIEAIENCLSNLNLCNSQVNNIPTNSEIKSINVQLKKPLNIVLNQNVPNPFDEKTLIQIELPEEIKDAKLIFYDVNGKLINSQSILDRGLIEINVYANDLSSGIYSYNLVINGEITDSKKMIKN